MSETPREGAIFRHDDGTREVVFAVADDHILTLKEYDQPDTFGVATRTAVMEGMSKDVAALSIDSFLDRDDET